MMTDTEPGGKTAPLTPQFLGACSTYVWQTLLNATRGDVQVAEGRVTVFLEELFPSRKNRRVLKAMPPHERLLAATKVLLTHPDGAEMLALLTDTNEGLDTAVRKAQSEGRIS